METNTLQRTTEIMCRTCRKKINVNKLYQNAKSCLEKKEYILALFNYDIVNDDPQVHPKLLCKECVGNLSRIKPENPTK